MVYSKAENGAFCKYCVLFSPSGVGERGLPAGKLVLSKFDNWKKAIEVFNEHENKTFHRNSALDADQFLQVSDGKKMPICQDIDAGLRQQVAKNRERLTPVITTVLWCGRQGVPLRGHRDGGKMDLYTEPGENEGNFKALLRLRACNGDELLKKHLEESSANATYTSWKTQNEIISACNTIILRKLVAKVNAAKCFAVMADETTDIGGVEQLSLCARYVDLEQAVVREEFLQFIPVADMTGRGLANTILSSLSDIGVATEYLRAQAYDGAASMSGAYNGVQAHIQQHFPNAMYVHCGSHSLNLSLSSACSVPQIRNCMGTVSKVCEFFHTPKRQAALTAQIEKLVPITRVTRLKSLCPTRWVQRHDAILVFVELLKPVLVTLQDIAVNWNDRESSSNAELLLSATQRSEFFVSLFVAEKVFSLSLPLSKYLQTINIDLSSAVQLAEDVLGAARRLRSGADEAFHELFEQIMTTSDELGLDIQVPRIVARQTTRSNAEFGTTEEYFRRCIFIPFLEAFAEQINERFVKHKSILAQFQVLLPSLPVDCPSQDDEKAVRHLCERYSSDVGDSISSVVGELHLWYKKIQRLDKHPKGPIDALKVCPSSVFPGVQKLLQIMATLPVTTSTNERSFSTLRRLKTYLRNTTGALRLNGLALLNVHREVAICADEILNELAAKPRRLDFKL